VGAEAESARCDNLSTAWKTWQEYLKGLPPQLEILRTVQNPELILSLTDLLDAAASEEDRRKTLGAISAFQETGHTDTSSLNDYFTSEGRELASTARSGRIQLLEALTYYFAFRHSDDGNAPRSCRDYLRPFLSSLRKGDAVITFNWDSLVERTLLEDGRWSPTDGYGFPRQFTHGFELQERTPIPDGTLPVSDIQVLKLHGSFGWKRRQGMVPNDLFLDANDFLSGFRWPDDLVLHDTAEPAHYSPTDPVVAYPSYLKQFIHPTMSLICGKPLRAWNELNPLRLSDTVCHQVTQQRVVFCFPLHNASATDKSG
jgi:hypothetical protein